jgi:hypothetical protein
MTSIEARRIRSSRLAYGYLVAVLLAYSLVILTSIAPPPFADYPDWVYQGVLFHSVLSGHPVAGYALKHYPVPNSTTTVGLGLLDMVLPWRWAAKVWICFYLALTGVATWVLARSLGAKDWRLVVALPGIVFLNLNFWYGHVSFEMGMCLVMLFISMLIRRVRTLWLMLLLIVIFFTHMEACACALLLLGIWCGVTREWKRLWAAVPAIMLTLWYGMARLLGGNTDNGMLNAERYGSMAFLLYKANTYFKVFGYVNACVLNGLSQSERIYGKTLFLLLICASLCMASVCLTLILRSVSKTYSDDAHKSIRIFVRFLLVISLILPQALLGTSDPGSRLLLIAVVIGMFLIEWRGRAGTTVMCLSVMFCLTNLWQFVRLEHDPTMSGHVKDLPQALLKYGRVEPPLRVLYYDEIQAGSMDQTIFPTGIFLAEKKK